jgi:RNA polymerase sigma-70 factor (ECF subfamily)
LPASNNVESEADEHSATERSLALIARLPPDQGEAVMLRVVAGLSVPVTAEIMGRSPGAIRVLSHRGLRRLEEMLSEAAVGTGANSFEMVAVVPSPSAPVMKNVGVKT